jgi:hypothetical protein
MLVQLFSGELVYLNRSEFVSDIAFYQKLTELYNYKYGISNTITSLPTYSETIVDKVVNDFSFKKFSQIK